MKNFKYSSKTDPSQLIRDYKNMGETKQNAAIMNPGHVDEQKWEEAKDAVKKEYGTIKWPVVMHIYEQMMGKK